MHEPSGDLTDSDPDELVAVRPGRADQPGLHRADRGTTPQQIRDTHDQHAPTTATAG